MNRSFETRRPSDLGTVALIRPVEEPVNSHSFMSLVPGARLGAYEITAAIGAGGMGEVYRGRDAALNRDVAIKVLPAAMAAEPERLARFKREAQLLASLNHPNIAAIFGMEVGAPLVGALDDALVGALGEDRERAGTRPAPKGPTVALVMELVEGEDLSERLKRGAIPVDESIAIAKQLAEGLEEAHEHGIIHRDLKPANVKVTPDGKVKILDFGLAKAMEGDPSTPAANSRLSHSPTMSRHMTGAGMIMGTAAYMSPEQARGKPVDKRADIWSFGVVLFEILTGRRAFEGGDVTEVLAAVIRDTPDLSALPPTTPEPIRRLLRRCLEKDPHERLPDISAARLEIKDALSGAPETMAHAAASPPPEARVFGLTRASIGWALAIATLTIALTTSLVTRPSVTKTAPGVIRFPLISGAGIRVTTGITQPFAISPDGSTIVFSGSSGEGVNLWSRTLDEPAPHMIADTEGGTQPSISPDGEWLAFVTANHIIRKVRIRGGGGATTITSLDDATAAIAWGLKEDILFERISSTSGIHRVSANGGTPELLIPLDGAANETGQRRPFVLRRERLVLYASRSKDGVVTLGIFSPDDGRRAHLPIEGVQALGFIDGDLIYSRADGALMAVPLDSKGMQIRGPARQLADRVAASGVGTAVTMSPQGTLVYRPSGAQASRLMLGDASGLATPLGSSLRAFDNAARFSPDGLRVAVGIPPGEEGEGLWILDRSSAEATRVGGAEDANLLGWTPDGRSLVSVRSPRKAAGAEIWATPVDGSGPASRLIAVDGTLRGATLAPDGRSVFVARRLDGSPTQELVRLSFDPSQPVATLVPSRAAGGTLTPGSPSLSPDGKWVAFVDESVYQVHVRAISGGGGIQVSDAGSTYAVWGRREGQLFYGLFDGLVEASLETAPVLTVRKRQKLEAWPSQGWLLDIASDGKTFLISQPAVDGSPALVALNWGASLRK